MLTATVARFAYRRDRTQIQGVEVGLGRGRTVLLGPNGAGKTTLLKAIAGVLAYEGTLAIDGISYSTSTRRPRSFRRAVGWLPQDVTPFPNLSVREHVAYAGWLKGLPMKQAWDQAEAALDAVGLESRARERAGSLSGGQTRRLGIAGVLVHDAAYLLLDEPTAGLDPRERERLVEILRPIEKERAVLISTHDTDSLIDDESRIHVLADGTTRFTGTYEQFVFGQTGDTAVDRVRRAYASLVPED
ncbi:ATP-binding cassette domain-containing protein [Microbacterium radiodurans]|uniref:ATP-binding cassette domain-containing protein n=1 Tax=Microbacterium radiodurans TaxID=661398 RepID=UPI00168A5645|nr:ATP-binding cassette domain-containing protein [Microbacterium radiodurans]